MRSLRPYLKSRIFLPHSSYQEVIDIQFSNNPLDCKAVCGLGDVAVCQGAAPTANRASELEVFQNRVRSTVNGSLKLKDIHSIFGINDNDDPCGRGDLIISGNNITNTGGSGCTLNASVALGNKDIGLTIQLPSKLSGTVTERNTDRFVVDFSDVSNTGTIQLDDAALNAQWGGPIQSIAVDEKIVYFGLPAACIKVPLP